MPRQTNPKVPDIRFHGFIDFWKECLLGELFPITSAARVHKNEWTESGVPFFRSSDVVSAFKGKLNTKAFISRELYEALSRKVGRVQEGDMLVTGGGSIGIPYLVKTDDPLYFKDADLIWFKLREAIDSHYLYTFLSSQQFNRYIKSISHIGTIAHYTVEQAKATPLIAPQHGAEQTKIGSYFKSLDRMIELHQRKHDKLVILKQAMLQKMFPQDGASTPEIRFNGFEGDWVMKRLKDVVDVYDGTHQTPSYTTQGVMFLSVENIHSLESAKYISNEAFKRDFKVFPQKGDVLMTRIGDIGTANVVQTNDPIAYYVSLALMKTDIADSYFLKYGIASDAVVKELFHRTLHIAFPKKINKNEIEKVVISLPILDEQQKIGTYFRNLDKLISKHATQLKKLKNIKSACLDKMFV